MTLTRAGAELAIASAVLAGLAVVAGYPELMLIAAAGAAALVTTVGWVAAGRSRLAVTRFLVPDRLLAGQTVTVRLLVTNRGSRKSPSLLATEWAGKSAYQVEVPPIEAGERREATYQIPAVRRGRLRLERTRLRRRDPLGLASHTIETGERTEVRVLPDWYPGIGPLPAEDLDPGLAETGLPGGDVVFHSLRDYRPGDPPRMVHWRATAKRGGWPVVREQTDPEEPVHVLLLDTSADAYGPDVFEEAVRIVASLTMAASLGGLGLELHTTGDGELLVTGPAQRREDDPGAVLDPLCEVRQSRQALGLDDVVDDLTSTVPGRYASAVLGVVTGRSAERAAAALTRAGQAFAAVHLIQVGVKPSPVSADGVVPVIAGSSGLFAFESGWGR